METMIPGLSIAAMVFSALVGIAVPVVLYIVFRKKGANHLPFWIGCITFVLFAFVLERLTLSVVMKTPFWTAVTGNLLLYGIVAGLFAGVFEEAGRFLAFKTVLRKKRGNDQNALMYGAGHGGVAGSRRARQGAARTGRTRLGTGAPRRRPGLMRN